MIYVFDRHENFLARLSNEQKSACPFWNADVKEKLNNEYTFSFTIPFDHPDAIHVQELGYVAFKDYEQHYQLFVITEINEIHAGELIKEVFCEHASVEMLDETIEEFFVNRQDGANTLGSLLAFSRWEVGQVDVNGEIHDLTVNYKSVREALTTFSERWKYEIRFRVSIEGNEITHRYVDAFNQRGFRTGKRFEYRNDLAEVRRTIIASGVKTALYGYGKEMETSTETTTATEKKRLTFSDIVWSTANGDPIDKPAGQTWIGLDSARSLYGFKRADGGKIHRFGIATFNEIESSAELIQATYDQLLEASKPLIQYEVKVIDLMKILKLESEMVHLGDVVGVIDADLNLRIEARVIEYNYDLSVPEASEVVLGNFLPRLTDDQLRLETIVSEAISKQQDLIIPEDVLREGDIIYTSWLEGAIDTAQNQVNAGGGTVSITQDQGILIVDDPTNPQKAIKLIAGSLALANERDPVTGLFNWRTFGTAEGFLADLVETGFLRFDRSRGGTLQLGGEIIGYQTSDGTPIYQNGVLKVVDSQGFERVTLTGDTGGFNELFVGQLRGNNIINTVQAITNVYVDPVNGNDERDGATPQTAKKRLQAVIDSIPKYNNYEVTIHVLDNIGTFTESIRIEGFFGSGRIVLYLGQTNNLQGDIACVGCTNEIMISTHAQVPFSTDASLRSTISYQNLGGGRGVIHIERCKYVHINRMIINGNNLSDYGVFAFHSNVRYRYNDSTNLNHSNVYGGYGTIISIEDSRGTAKQYGLTGIQGSVWSGVGTAPRGGTLQKNMINGAVCDISWTHVDAPTKTVESSIKTITRLEANDVASYFRTSGGYTEWELGYATQGSRWDYPTTAWYGVFFFNLRNFGFLKNADGTNRKIDRIRILIQRTNHTGENVTRYPRLYYTDQSTASGTIGTISGGTDSTIGFKWGEQKWIELPIAFGTAFQNGSAKSIAIYDFNEQDNFMRFEGKASLEITHS